MQTLLISLTAVLTLIESGCFAAWAADPKQSCSPSKPCVSHDHDCSGNDIFEVGRNQSYTMDACTALCKATQGCTGFVLDAIIGEEKAQCKINPKPGEACCLMKTECINQQAKPHDTAVSFQPVPPPPPPPGFFKAWCPAYHRIHSASMCDPSGPIQTADGVWHVFDDCTWCTADVAPKFPCPWAHYTSTDLLHWIQVPFSVGGCAAPNCGNPFHSTGSLSRTGSGGIIAMNGYLEGGGGLQTSVTTDPKLETWPNATIVAPHPKGSTGGFRDPARAISLNGSWYVGVGSGTKGAAQVLFFKAQNENLSKFDRRVLRW